MKIHWSKELVFMLCMVFVSLCIFGLMVQTVGAEEPSLIFETEEIGSYVLRLSTTEERMATLFEQSEELTFQDNFEKVGTLYKDGHFEGDAVASLKIALVNILDCQDFSDMWRDQSERTLSMLDSCVRAAETVINQ